MLLNKYKILSLYFTVKVQEKSSSSDEYKIFFFGKKYKIIFCMQINNVRN
jgi:hypothetical protein